MSKSFQLFITAFLSTIIGGLSVLWFQSMSKEAAKKEAEVASIQWRQNHFMLSKENLYNELVAQDIDFPEIVEAQAILETGNFKSYSCVCRNNLFGLRNKNGTYMSFEHWTLAVAAYKKYIQKYDTLPENYYKYLDNLGYAEDPNYIIKLKEIVNKK